jgi:tRNA(Phe) wybutosine-synthesizing methylase Tyw3
MTKQALTGVDMYALEQLQRTNERLEHLERNLTFLEEKVFQVSKT